MQIEKTIISVIEFVPKTINDILNELSRTVPLTEKDRLDLNIILEEAITNAIQHGNQFDTSQKVGIILEYDNEMVTIRVKDQGAGFDHQNPPNIKETNEKMSSSGRGIFLVKKIADDVTFDENGAEICIRKKLSSKNA